MEEEYVCLMDEASQKVARDELKEDPKERDSQVETFRQWILQQQHITAPTDTTFLLKFLRTAKFSQLKAREILEGNLKSKTTYPDWLEDLDTADPDQLAFLRTGYMMPIAQRDSKGRKILMINEGAFEPNHKKYKVKTIVRALFSMTYYLMMDEDSLVNGIVFFEDFSHMTMKHMTFWGMDNMSKLTKLFEGNFPGRYKEFHYFNPGPVFESLMVVMKPLLSKKMQDRFYVHGKNMETIYKVIPQQYFPDEYLPDDYKGARQGPTNEIIENFIKEMTSPRVRERILYETSARWKFDASSKLKGEPVASFRKLNVE